MDLDDKEYEKNLERLELIKNNELKRKGIKQHVYAMYKGDKWLDDGTLTELANRHNIKRTTMVYYSSRAYRERIEHLNQKKEADRIILIKVEE